MTTRLLRHLFAFSAMLIAFGAPPTYAGSREDAELTRLVDDLDSLAERQIWSGVERRYEQILALDDVQIPMEVHLQAAQAAQASGDMGKVLDRLNRAQSLSETEDITNWIREIEENYGQVELSVAGARSAALSIREMPFAPDQRQQVELAIAAMEADGFFLGMLPSGWYDLEGKAFEVNPGVSTKVDLSLKELRQERRAE